MDTYASVDSLDVLVIDDDQELSAMVASVLEHDRTQAFRTRVARTAEAGLAAYDEQPADVVVLDLGLPDVPRAKPLEVLRRLLECHPAPCVVVLTAHPWGLGRDAVRMGAEDYLDKGDLSLRVLRDTILYAVERHAHGTREAANSAAQSANTPTRGPAFGAERLRGPLSLLTDTLEQLRVTGGDLKAVDASRLLDQALRTSYAMGGQLDQVVATQRRVDDREAVDLGGLAEAVIADLQGLAQAVHANVTLGPLPRLWGQREPLRLLLRNLVLNALQHTRPGVTVEVTAVDHPRGVRLLVDDDGPGIASDRRAALFAPQPAGDLGVLSGDDVTQHATRHFGLRACSAVATAHGGRCWIEDRPGGGARIVVELPIRRREG